MLRRASIVIALALAACGSGEALSPEAPAATVGDVGQLPATFPSDTAVAPTTDAAPAESTASTEPGDDDPGSPTTVGLAEPVARPVGRLVDGNRLLVIGDSILASTSRRYGDDMCDRLVPMGWAVEVDAESGQQIDFGRQVLRQRLPAGWDAAVIMLGNNYGGDAQAYADVLADLLEDLAPRPVVLVTVTEFREDRAEVNYVIHSTATQRDNVHIVDWAERTRAGRADGLLSGDGLHLADAGRGELVAMIGRALGRAPAGSEGECLPTRFTNDSAGPVGGPRSGGSGSAPPTTVARRPTTVPTTQAPAPTTQAPAPPATTQAPAPPATTQAPAPPTAPAAPPSSPTTAAPPDKPDASPTTAAP